MLPWLGCCSGDNGSAALRIANSIDPPAVAQAQPPPLSPHPTTPVAGGSRDNVLEGLESSSSPTSSAASFSGSTSGLEDGGARTPDSLSGDGGKGDVLPVSSSGIPLSRVKLDDRCGRELSCIV